MTPFHSVSGAAAPMTTPNIDTDVIMPKMFLKGVDRSGLGDGAFNLLRFTEGKPNPDFVLNQDGYRDACFLIVGPNFGCGSSREGAVWSLQERGIRAIIGSSFGDIFFANCFQNGILPVIVDKVVVDQLAADIEATQGAGKVSIDLEAQTIVSPSGTRHAFEIDPRRREGLLKGLDEVALTLQRDAEVHAFQASDRAARPWIHSTRTPA